MRISACTATLGDIDLLDAIERIAQIGYDGVEITVLYHLRPELTTARRIREVRDRLDSTGLKASALHFLLPAELTLTGDDAGLRRRTSVYLGRLAEMMADLGGSALMVGGGGIRNYPAHLSRSDAEQRVAEVLHDGAELAEPYGVDLAFEALNRFETTLGNTLADVQRVVDKAPHPHLGIGGDLFHMNIEESDPAEAIRSHVGSLRHLHLAENNRRGPGSGHVDFPSIVRALIDSGYDRWVSMELFWLAPGIPTFPFDVAEKELTTGLRHVRDLVNQAEAARTVVA